MISLQIPKYNILSVYGLWDPTARASFSTTRNTGLPTSALQALDAAAVTKSLTQPYSLSYAQTFETGTSYSVTYSGAKTSQTNSFANYNPSLTSNLNFSVTQPLIKNRGMYLNRIPLMMAQSNYKVSGIRLEAPAPDPGQYRRSAYWNANLGAVLSAPHRMGSGRLPRWQKRLFAVFQDSAWTKSIEFRVNTPAFA